MSEINSEIELEVDRIKSAVKLFSLVMEMRLKGRARQGWQGWDDKKYEKVLKDRLKKNVEQLLKGDTNISAIDTANFAMMLWYMNLPEFNF